MAAWLHYWININMQGNNKELKIKEQIWPDASGLILEFVVIEDDTFPYRIRIYGEILPYGNREIFIAKNGKVDGGGTHLGEPPFAA